MVTDNYKGFHLYFAGGGIKEHLAYMKELGCLRLASWFNEKRIIDKWVEDGNDIFVDSGAYSAHTKGVLPDVDAYIEYLNANDAHVIIAAQLDKIPGVYRQTKTTQQLLEAPEISWENYLYMRPKMASWRKLLPVYHQGENLKHLHRLLESTFEGGEHIPYIGISPANDMHTSQKDAWLTKVFDVIKHSSNPNVKTHGFGITSLAVLEKQPLYSADSTRWILTAAYGQILTKYGNIIVSDTSDFKAVNLVHMAPEIQENIKHMVAEAGFDIEELKVDTLQRGLFNIWYLKDWSDHYVLKQKTNTQNKLF